MSIGSEPPVEFWRDVPCGHPNDPFGWLLTDGTWACHCGQSLGFDRALPQSMTDAPGPVVPCDGCGCFVCLNTPAPTTSNGEGL